MSPSIDMERAERMLQRALQEQMAGRYGEAVKLYKESLAACPTAEAHTYLGWTYSFMGRLDDAIAECHNAIAVDPGFGNPYNDIGSYLMKQGKLVGAIAWLEKAKTAPRYEPRHYPYLNLARLYMSLGRYDDASRELSQAQFIHREVVAPGSVQEAGPDETAH
jgi:tetratricopeptide (TPR) repeat protein